MHSGIQPSGGVQDDVDKETGAITLKLEDVRNAMGHEREEWKNAMSAELQSLRHHGAIHDVIHVPKKEHVLPMKVVLTLKPVEGTTRRKIMRGSAFVVIFRRRWAPKCYTPRIGASRVSVWC